MQKNWQSLLWHLTFCCTLLIFMATSHGVEAQGGKPVAEIIALTGRAEVKSSPEASFRPVQLRHKLYPRNQIRTLEKSKVKLWFQDESIMILGEKTTLEIAQYLLDQAANRRQSLLRTLKGKMRFIVSKFFGAPQSHFNIETPTAVVGIRGTDGVVEIESPDHIYLLAAATPLSLKNKSTGEILDLQPMRFVISQARKPFQVKRITPAIYKRLMTEFQMSYDFEPKNLVEPPSPPEGGLEIPDSKITVLPPVDQAPLSPTHRPPADQAPLPVIHHHPSRP